MTIGGLIIAAGYSGRMKKFKPLLEFNGRSFLINILEKLDQVCGEIVVVIGHNRTAIEFEMENNIALPLKRKTEIVFNPEYYAGMFSSLQTGAASLSNSDWVLYHFIDQPAIPEKFYPDFRDQIDAEFDWIQPVYGKRKGHPILLSPKAIQIIRESENSESLRAVSKSISRKKYWDCEYSEILDDIDTPADYKSLLEK